MLAAVCSKARPTLIRIRCDRASMGVVNYVLSNCDLSNCTFFELRVEYSWSQSFFTTSSER